MCNHDNLVLNEHGASTCFDCSIYFEKSFSSDYTTNYNGPILKHKSSISKLLEKDFGIYDYATISIAEKIFTLASKNKLVKGANKRSILCASLYYTYHYLKKPLNFEELLTTFKISQKNGSKGLKTCQIAMQECERDELKQYGCMHLFSCTHKEKLSELIRKYNIPIKNYNEIEKVLINGHLKKNKTLNDKINALWISCIFFWLLKVNPLIDAEEFISINDGYTTLHRLKSDLLYLNKNLN